MAPSGESQGLYLIVEAADSTGAAVLLSAALTSAAVRAVLLAPAPGKVVSAETTRSAVELAQSHGIAALIEDDEALARALRADGVHLTWSSNIEQRFQRARETLGARAIVGVEASASRHDAMTLAEAGADYVAFALPTATDDREAARAERLNLCAWWSEIFEVPCVAFDCADPTDVRDLTAAGADFLAVRLSAGSSPSEVAERISFVTRALSGREGVS